MFCRKCGRNIDDKICPYCGADTEESTDADSASNTDNPDNADDKNDDYYLSGVSYEPDIYEASDVSEDILKSRTIAGLLQIFLGAFGIGRFYLGYYKIALWQIIASLLTMFIGGSVWGFIDGIRILNGKPIIDGYGRDIKN